MSAFDIIRQIQDDASGLPAEERLRVARALINAGEALAASVHQCPEWRVTRKSWQASATETWSSSMVMHGIAH